MKKLDLVAGGLLLVGGLNWGLVAVAEFDLVAWIFGMFRNVTEDIRLKMAEFAETSLTFSPEQW